MKNIDSYVLESCYGTQTIYLPTSAEIIDVQKSDLGITLFYITDPLELKKDLRTFVICGLRNHLYENNYKYIGFLEDSVKGTLFILEVID